MKEFFNYVYKFAEDIIGVSTCIYTFLNIPISSLNIESVIGLFAIEFIKATFSLFTAIASAFIISKLKPHFKSVNKTTIKKLFKNEKSNRKNIK